MADYIGKLAVKLTADSADFSSAMSKAASTTAATGRVLDSATRAAASNAATQRQAAQVVESVKTPWERHSERLQKLNRLYQAGAIDVETYDRAVAKSERRAGRESGERGSSSQLMGRLGRLAGGLALIQGASAVAESAIARVRADSELAQSVVIGSASGILTAQKKAYDAQDDIVKRIPLVGNAISSVMSVWGDRTYIEQAIRNIDALDKRVVESAAYRKSVERETALAVAENEGRSAAEIGAIKRKQSDEDRLAKLRELQDTSRALAQQIADAESAPSRLAAIESAKTARAMLDAGEGTRWDVAAERKATERIEASDAVIRDLVNKRRAVDADIAAIKAAQSAVEASEGVKAQRDTIAEQERNASLVTAFMQSETDKRIQAVWMAANAAIEAAEKQGRDITDIINVATQREADIRKAAYEQTEAGRAAQQIENITAALQNQAAVAGMTAQQIELYRLKTLGASDAQLQLAAALQQQISAAQADAEWKQKAEAVLKSIESPQDRYRKQVEDLNTMLDLGLITQTQYTKALEGLGGSKNASGSKGEGGRTGAMEFGTAQAYSVALSTPMESVNKGVWETAVAVKRTNQILERQRSNNSLEVVSIG